MVKDLVYKVETYTDKSGKEKRFVKFYLRLKNGGLLRISPYETEYNGKVESTFKELLLVGNEII